MLFVVGCEIIFRLFYCWFFSDNIGVCNVMCCGKFVVLLIFFVVFFWNRVSYLVLFIGGILSLILFCFGNGGSVLLFVV